jgi:hypothetical protein
MMRQITGSPVMRGGMIWHYGENNYEEPDTLRIAFHYTSYREQYQRRQLLKTLEGTLQRSPLKWLTPGPEKWTINLDLLKDQFEPIRDLKWIHGTIELDPEFEPKEREVFDRRSFEASIAFYLTENSMQGRRQQMIIPIEIKESLVRFQKDYPDPTKVAFVMMRFGNTPAHQEIVDSIRTVLSQNQIKALRADDRQYHDDLFPNVLTYIYGCSFGCAVFERLESEDFNPNVSLEVGYMFALQKPVCLLKDKTLKTLHTDLVGKLYRTFDPQNPSNSIPAPLMEWCMDKGVILRP